MSQTAAELPQAQHRKNDSPDSPLRQSPSKPGDPRPIRLGPKQAIPESLHIRARSARKTQPNRARRAKHLKFHIRAADRAHRKIHNPNKDQDPKEA